MKDAFREFRAAAPRLMAWWFAIAAGVFPIALLFGLSPAESLAAALGTIPLGMSMIGLMWFSPFWGDAIPTRAHVAVAFGWTLLLFIPAVALGALTMEIARRLLGIEG